MIISEKIFQILAQKGMSQKEFSEKTGISQSTISDWKRKKTNPSIEKVLKICEVLQVSPYALLAEDESWIMGASDKDEISLSEDEQILLENYRSFMPKQQERLWGYINALRDIK